MKVYFVDGFFEYKFYTPASFVLFLQIWYINIMNNNSNDNFNLAQEIKNTFESYRQDREEFCRNMIMMALNDDFGKYIENDTVVEQIFTLSVQYCDTEVDENSRTAIWSDIEKIVSSID